MATTGTAVVAKRGSSNSRRLILLILTSGFFITGLLFDYMPMIVDNQIKRTVELATNEEIQSIWSRPPVDFHSYYWLYDILNADKFTAGQEKIRVRRVGPYHFTSRMEKKILDVSQNKYRVSFNSTRHIHLDPSSSVSLDEPLVLLNAVYASLISGAREFTRDQDAQSRQMMLSSVGRMAERFNETLFINATARSALIGRRLLIVEKLIKMAETFGFDINLPSIAQNKLFGYVSVLNGTWDGPFEIYSGYQASMNSLGDIISYQGKKRLTEFQGRCNRLQASAGELRPMPIHENQTLEMFQPRFCRIVHLSPTGTRKLKEGQAISYELSADDFLSAQMNPDNRCYCLNGTLNSYCSLNGAIELGPCSYHSPIVVTASHIRPDERITGSVMNWDPDMQRGDIELLANGDDRSQILVLKRLGVPVQGDITLTLFMKVIRDPTFRQTSLVPEESFIPILTVRERGVIPPKLAQIIINLESFLGLTNHLKVVMYLTAIVLLCSLTGHYYTKSGAPSGGPRVTPSSNGDDLASQRSSDPARPGRRNSNGGTGARNLAGSRVALPALGPNSERANSADSSRSQPPSRISQRSLDVGSGDETAADSSGEQTQRQASGSSDQLISESTATAVGRAQPLGQAVPQQHRIFSKVDEQAGLESGAWRAKRPADSDSDPKRPTVTTTNGPADSSSSSASACSAGLGLGGGQTAGDSPGTEAAPANRDSSKRPAANKRNWFMKVCSNFVRMLSGIRSSINDAGQLDINENDYQDKQLEMLAGKIDSWYQSSPVTPDLSLATSGTGGAREPSEAADEAASISGEPKIVVPGNEQHRREQVKARANEPLGAGCGAKQVITARGQTSGLAEAGNRQRMNKEEDDAGFGSEGEETSRLKSPAGSSPPVAGPAVTNEGSAGPASSPAEASQASACKLAGPGPNKADRVPSVSFNCQPSDSERDLAAREPTGMSDNGGPQRAKNEAGQVERSELSMEEKEGRRDSVQSNETVINKRSRQDTDTEADMRRLAAQQTSDSMLEGPAGEQPRKPPLGLAKMDTSKDLEVGVVAASAAGESNKELAQDKRAALESVELALTAANPIEGY